MYSTYTLNTDELSSQFISVLQHAYPGKKVEITVQESQDETEYLLKDSQLLKGKKVPDTKFVWCTKASGYTIYSGGEKRGKQAALRLGARG